MWYDMNIAYAVFKKCSLFLVLVLTCMFTLDRCKVVKEAPYAVLKKPLPYNTTDFTSQYGDDDSSASIERQHVTESPVINTKSPESRHTCSSKDPPRGDTFYHRRTKGKGCKRYWKLYTAAPSRAHNTTSSKETSRLHASTSITSMSNKKRAGKKKSTRKGLSTYPKQRNQVPPQVTTSSYPQTTSTTQGAPSTAQKPALQLHLPTAVTAVTETTISHKKGSKQSRCCAVRITLRGDNFQPHCKSCPEQTTTSHMTAVTPSTAAYGLPIKATTIERARLKQSTETPQRDTWSEAPSAAPATTQAKTTASVHKDGKPRKQMVPHLLWNNTSQEPMGRAKAPNSHAERGLKLNIGLHNMTGECMHHLCWGLLQHKRALFSITKLNV